MLKRLINSYRNRELLRLQDLRDNTNAYYDTNEWLLSDHEKEGILNEIESLNNRIKELRERA